MKKIFVVMLSVALVMAFAVGTVLAKPDKKPQSGPFDTRAVFEADVVKVVDDACTAIGEVFVRAETGDFKLEIKDAAIMEGDEFHVAFYCAGEEAFSGDFSAAEDGELVVFETGKVNFDCQEPSVVITGTSLDAYSGFCLGYLAD